MLTFGKVAPQPNTVNVVPGKTVFTMDCRHTDALELTAFTEVIEADMRRICQEMDIGIEIDLWMDEAPVPMDTKLVAQLTALCEREGEFPRDAQRSGTRRADFRSLLPDLHDLYAKHQRHQP